MSSQYHRITIREVSAQRVILDLVVTDAVNGSHLYEGKTWALMALHEPTHTYLEDQAKPSGPLADAATFDQLMDSKVARPLAGKIIQEVRLVELRNLPIEDDIAYNERVDAEGTPSEETPWAAFARYEIALTDAKWAAHLRPGLWWDSCAFEV